jgi:predicted transcriptional regulator
MHKGVVTCDPADNLKRVAEMMRENQFRSVVVADPSGDTWGLISVMEIIRFVEKDLEKVTAEEAMRPYKIEVDPQWPVEKAIELMKSRKIEHLMIIDPHAGPKRAVGILTSFDIVRYMSQIEVGKFEQILKFPNVDGGRV